VITMKGSALLVKSLVEHEVEYVFGLPGDTSLDWYEALYDRKNEITHILATDERNAAYMADAYARITNKPGICEGPSGAGATYLLPGLYEAYYSSIPLIAINTDIPLTQHGKAVLTELDQDHLFKKATKWNITVDHVTKIPELMKKAFREATTGRPGAVHLAFPTDVLASTCDIQYENNHATKTPAVRFSPPLRDIKKALNLIMESEMPFIIAGGGIHLSTAHEALEKIAVAIGSPVGTSITGKGSINEHHPLSAGVIGENGGNAISNKMIMESDLILFVGTQAGSVVTCHWQVPPDDGTRTILQIDIDPQEIGRNYTVDCGLVGDARAVLEKMLQLLEKKVQKHDRAERLCEKVRVWKEQQLENVDNTHYIHPLRIVKICKDVLPENTILIADPGTPTPYFASFYRSRQGRVFLDPRAYGALGYAIPATVGVYMADRTARIVSLTGDGSILVSMAELSTIVRENIPAICILFQNNEYSWIKTHIKHRKDEKYLSVDLPDVKYDMAAASMGLTSYVAENASEFEESLRRALKNEEPSFIDAKTLSLHRISSSTLPWKIH
jgi:acetolactate synthase-1/2/3 large subunit